MFPFFFSQRVLKTITKQQYEKCSRLSHATKNYFWRCFYYLEPNKREVINVISRSIVVWLPLDICTFTEHKLFKKKVTHSQFVLSVELCLVFFSLPDMSFLSLLRFRRLSWEKPILLASVRFVTYGNKTLPSKSFSYPGKPKHSSSYQAIIIGGGDLNYISLFVIISSVVVK